MALKEPAHRRNAMAAQSPSLGLLCSSDIADVHAALVHLDAEDAVPRLEVEQGHQVLLHPFLGEDHQIQDGRQTLGAVQTLDEPLLEVRRAGCGLGAWDGVHPGIVPEAHPEAVGLEVRHHLGDGRKLGVRAAIHPAADPLEQQLAVGLEVAAEPYRPDEVPSAA